MSVSSTIEKGQRRTWHQWKATGLLGLHEKLNAKRLEALMASLQGHGFGFGNTHFWPWFSRPSLVPCHLFSVEVGNWDWEQHFLVFFCFLVLFAPTSERRNEGAPEYAPGTWKRTSSLTTHFHTHSLTHMHGYIFLVRSVALGERVERKLSSISSFEFDGKNGSLPREEGERVKAIRQPNQAPRRSKGCSTKAGRIHRKFGPAFVLYRCPLPAPKWVKSTHFKALKEAKRLTSWNCLGWAGI